MKKKKSLFFIAGISLVIFLFSVVLKKHDTRDTSSYGCGKYMETEVEFSAITVDAQIADDACKRNLGLSFRPSLPNDTALLFMFPQTGNYGFWMKDMHFPIDMIWISDDLKIIGIAKHVATSTYPQIFGEDFIARYVIEANADFADKNNLKVGEKIKIF